MAVFPDVFTVRRRWFVLLTLVAFGLALCIGFYLWHAVQASSIVAIQARIDTISPTLAIIRCLVIGLVMLLWPIIIRAIKGWGAIGEARTAQLISVRWRVVTWLVVIELMLGQNILGSFLVEFREASA